MFCFNEAWRLFREKLSRVSQVVYQGGDRISSVQNIIVWKYMLWEECKDERDECSGVVDSRLRRCMWEIR